MSLDDQLFRFISMGINRDDLWNVDWIWTAFWHILYLAVLTAIVVIWRPTANNARYSYAEMPSDGEIDMAELSSNPPSYRSLNISIVDKLII
jgi:hypothetical protein